ncbi:TonB-dependent receptor [Sphingomonas humi]|uniref:TonB-dependent receptor n=2 Tax=Sphingomonas humi TaxID=335630 RepID=A0ABP7RR00_9SPHN
MNELGTRTALLSMGSALALALTLAAPAAAQSTTGNTTDPAATPTGAETPIAPANASTTKQDSGEVIVTGSRIRRDPNNSALPLQIITTQEIVREGIQNPEQLISFLSTNGNGADNLASNSDVVSGAQRGTNGLSAANLRGQGSASTLILLNGRRVAAHGLQGSAVDVNQIPFSAIERVEILKDGASAIYGTDAIGGVINFITRKDYKGLSVQGMVDATEAGGGNIYRVSGVAGYGDLANQGFNVMGAVAYSSNRILRGSQRDFVNGNQPLRGLSIDTRGTPIATAFPINPTAANVGITQGGTLLGGTTGATSLLTNPGFFIPGTTVPASGGVNPLRLPGGAGCSSVDGGLDYDAVLWAAPNTALACAWDTGRAATIQQPIDTLTYYTRATVRLADRHELYAEVTGSDASSTKTFSNNQYTGNNTSLPIAYPLNALTASTYNSIYDRFAAVLPAIGAVGDRTVDNVGNYGKPIAFRYRCIACGPRQYETNTKTLRAALGIDGPLFGTWDYRAGGSFARSEAKSTLGTGYHYRGVFASAAAAAASGIAGAGIGTADPRAPTAPGATAPGIVGLFNSGILNPFSLEQTPQALAALDAISAKGVELYGGIYEVKQFDGSVSGDLFRLPGGTVKVALGVDYRQETYRFNGSAAGATSAPDIFNVAFDNVNALNRKKRNVKAAYGEVLIPIIKELELTGAIRIDDYTGFGSTVNPKISAKFRPIDALMFRGSYNTGFRVPTFNQIFNGTTISPNPGNNVVDPTLCAQGTTAGPRPACDPITPDSLNGGNLTLKPETSKQWTVGVVLQPSRRFSLSADYWNIAVDDTIGSITISQLLANIGAFPERIQRTNGIITLLDLRTGNFGSRRTAGIELSGRAAFDAPGGLLSTGIDGTYLTKKKEKLLPNLPYTDLVGVFSLTGDLGLKWKHNLFVNYTTGKWNFNVSQIFRKGYRNFALPASTTRLFYNPRVDNYITYNASIGFTPWKDLRLTAGVKNVFDTDPPFAITYDSNSGAGSSWEPRVADPRGRAFLLSLDWKLF